MVAAGVTGAEAGGAPWSGQEAPFVAEGESVIAPDASGEDSEQLALPAVPKEMNDLAASLSEQYGTDPQFSAVEVTRDRTQVIVYWHGEITTELARDTSTVPSVEVVIEQTEFMPGELRDAARRLVESDARVASAAALYDGSGIRVSLDEVSGPSAQRSAEPTLQERLQNEAHFPLTFDNDVPQAAFDNARLSDISYHLGGARLTSWNTGAGCTSGFTVVKDNDASARGLMFAAHCGAVGEQWVTPDRSVTPVQWYLFGTTATRDVLNDGAILTTTFANPYMWTAEYNSTIFSAINGQTTPYIGQELCFSGSYSGLNCGNLVSSTTENYSLGGDLTAVFGMRTTNVNDQPAAGNGDSGGPGYTIVSSSAGAQRLAVGIISAIPTGSPTTCQGVPGASDGRRCSPTVWLTSVVAIGNNLGWRVPTT